MKSSKFVSAILLALLLIVSMTAVTLPHSTAIIGCSTGSPAGETHTAIYQFVMNQNSYSLQISSIKYFIINGSLYAEMFVNTGVTFTNKEQSPCDQAVNNAQFVDWEDIINATGLLQTTNGEAENAGTSGAFYLVQNVAGITTGNCATSVTTPVNYIYTEIVDQNGNGLHVTSLHFWRHFDATKNKYHLWTDIVVNTTSTFTPTTASGCTVSFGSSNNVARWQAQSDGTVETTYSSIYGGTDSSGNPIVQQGIAVK